MIRFGLTLFSELGYSCEAIARDYCFAGIVLFLMRRLAVIAQAWCQELEVFHNPQAANPIPFDLIPGAIHWFERDGDVVCSTIWANSVLASVTYLRMSNEANDSAAIRPIAERRNANR